MAKFQFRLATLLKLRESHRDELRSRLAEAYRAEQLLHEQSAQLEIEIDALQQARREFALSPNTNVNNLLEAQRYQMTLRTQHAALAKQAELLTAETEKRRQAVIEADRTVKVLEKLRERQVHSHRQAVSRSEANLLDEIASQRAEVTEPWVQ